MNTIYVLNEYITNGFRAELLDIIATLAVLSGILVIVCKNPILSVLFLICLFLTIAGYLIVLGLNFIGLSYLLVYVGAVSILFIFILMLLNVRISELLGNTRNSIPLAIFIIVSIYYPLYPILPYSIYPVNTNEANLFYNTEVFNISDQYNSFIKLNNSEINKLYFVNNNVWDGNLSETSHITSIGNVMYTNYSMWLLLTSIILLLAMVGTIVITIKQKS
jgi:NADH-ubiquinone oxidoreductase chain 6